LAAADSEDHCEVNAPSVPVKLINRLKKLFRGADAAWDERGRATRPGELSCRAGCFGCCLGPFEISLVEAVLARLGVERLAPEEQTVIRDRAEELVRTSKTLFPGDAESGLLDPERTEAADDAYFASVANVACPMLELPSGRCRIYEERPITCRTYGLAWVRQGELVYPACSLNFVGEKEARQRETAIDLDRLLSGDQEMAELARRAGLPAGAETTLAHAVVGSVFERGNPDAGFLPDPLRARV
jgi:Fe-S-cluster containining protein